MISRPVALGSSVPQWPTFLIPNLRRMASTTSWDVGPAGLSIRIAPSSAVNSCMRKLSRRVQRALDGGDDVALDRKRFARDAGAGGRRMAAAAELRGNLVHVDVRVF